MIQWHTLFKTSPCFEWQNRYRKYIYVSDNTFLNGFTIFSIYFKLKKYTRYILHKSLTNFFNTDFVILQEESYISYQRLATNFFFRYYINNETCSRSETFHVWNVDLFYRIIDGSWVFYVLQKSLIILGLISSSNTYLLHSWVWWRIVWQYQQIM